MAESGKQVFCVTVASHKGGVGKTTAVAQIGAGFSVATDDSVGLVVLVDADPQGSLGAYLGVGSEDDFARVLLGERTIGECLVEVPGFSKKLRVLRGSGRTWEDVECVFVREKGSPDMEPLPKRLTKMFDLLVDLVEDNQKILVFTDTAPSFSELQAAALLVADYVLCPITLDYGGEQGMLSTWEWFQAMRQLESAGNKQREFGVLPQKIDLENALSKRDLRRMQLIVGQRVLPGIPYSDEVVPLIDRGQTIWTSREMKDSAVNSQYAAAMDIIAAALGLELRWKPESKKSSKRGG